MKVKIKKSVELGVSGTNIRVMYDRELKHSCEVGSIKYKNCTEAFDGYLQDLVNEAFELGQSEATK